MKKIFLLCFTLLIVSCGEKKVVQLPEINNSKITEIGDVSHAYLFYNETMPDSVELNRKNLISTTNWLFNVDKRLTLKQAIPHIKFLQAKKSNSSHKNEKAKNYFTCHNISENNLGFMEFTETNYHFDMNDLYERKSIESSQPNNEALARFISLDSINIYYPDHETPNIITSLYSKNENLTNDLQKIKDSVNLVLYLSFNSNISFKNYINLHEIINSTNLEGIKISNHEFIIDSL